MAVSAIGTDTTSTSTTSSGMSAVTGNDFMKILLTQLQYQDPLKPMDNEQMIRQMSTIRELEMNSNMSRKLEQLTDQQRFGSAAALIGRHVKGTVSDEEGNEFPVEGVVTSLRFTSNGEAMLELDSGETLPLSKLQEVRNPGTSSTTGGDSTTLVSGASAAA